MDRYFYYKDLDRRLSQLELQRFDWTSKVCYGCKYNSTGKRIPLYLLTNIYSGFDIETSTVFGKNIVNGKENFYSTMYIAMFSINDTVVLFRTWLECREFFVKLPRVVGLSPCTYILTWVHNLDYENSYIKHRFNIDSTTFFGKDKQHPIKYLLENHFFFHDSYSVTNTSLEKLAENYKCKHKKSKDLDYEIVRNSQTKLSDTELGYCCNDVLILSDFSEIMITEFLMKRGFIPDTSTQILSKELQENAVKYAEEFIPKRYNKIMKDNPEKDNTDLILKSIHGKIFGYEFQRDGVVETVKGIVDSAMFTPFDENHIQIPVEGKLIYGVMYYDFYEWLFRGGYTKSNARYTSTDTKLPDGLLEDIGGFDYTSSYPFVQTICNFPVSPFREIEITLEQAEKLHLFYGHDDFEKYRFIFIIEFYDIQSIDDFALESESKAKLEGESLIDNGRIRTAEKMTVCLTDCDFALYQMYYQYDRKKSKILKAWRATAGKLPEYFLETLWTNGVQKQRLKNVEGKEVEYNLAKMKFNAGYGLCCKQPVYIEYKQGNEITPTGYKTTERVNLNYFEKSDVFTHTLDGVSEDFTRIKDECSFKGFKEATRKSILSPFWGIWTSAFARFNLLYCVKRISNDSEWKTNDVIYNDTDSLYMRNWKKHMFIINEWNVFAAERVKNRLPEKYPELLTLGQFTNIAEEDSKGHTDHFTRFKTLGAKRYIKTFDTADGEKIKVTVAGLPKGTLEKYCKKHNLDIYREFSPDMDFTIEEHTELVKLARSYHDELVKINVAGEIMIEYSSCTLYPSTFKIKLNDIYYNFLNNLIAEQCKKKLALEVFRNERQ